MADIRLNNILLSITLMAITGLGGAFLYIESVQAQDMQWLKTEVTAVKDIGYKIQNKLDLEITERKYLQRDFSRHIQLKVHDD